MVVVNDLPKYMRRTGEKGTLSFWRRVPEDVKRTSHWLTQFNKSPIIKKSLRTPSVPAAMPEFARLLQNFEHRLAICRGQTSTEMAVVVPAHQSSRRRDMSRGEIENLQRTFYEQKVRPILELRMDAVSDPSARRKLDEFGEDFSALADAMQEFLDGNAHRLRWLQNSDNVPPPRWRKSREPSEREEAARQNSRFSCDAEREARDYIDRHGIDPSYLPGLTVALNDAERTACEHLLEARKGNLTYRPDKPFLKEAGRTNNKPKSGMTLLDLQAQYLKANPNLGLDWQEKTDRTIRLFHEFVGSKPSIEAIDHANVQDFIDALARYPSRPKNHFKGLSFHKTIEANEALGNKKHPYITSATIRNGHLAILKTLLNFGRRRQLIPINPAGDIEIPGRKQHRERESRAFEIDELDRLFHLPPWTGCKSRKRPYSPGQVKLKDHRVWVPLVALFTGARCGEIAMIRLDEVLTEGKHPYIHLGEDATRRKKTRNALRDVPILDALSDLGFMDYVHKMRQQGHERLFPDWHPRGRREIYANETSINQFNTKLVRRALGGPFDPDSPEYNPARKKPCSFHSLRKNFKTLLARSNVPTGIVDQVLGHEVNDMDRRYIEKYPVDMLYEATHTIRYEGLDLSHLELGND